MKAVSLVLTSLLVCALAMPGMAADSPIASATRAAPSRTLVDLDLSSTDSNLNAAHVVNTRPVTICVGGKPLLVTSHTHLTAAEMVAVYQVINSGRQAIQIGVHRNAVGGSVVITSGLARNLGSLVIPQGVTVIDNASALTLGGSLINSGTLFAVSTDPGVRAASITATNIMNRQDGIITTELPAGGLPGFTGATANLSLTLTATDCMTNSGTISSAGRLIMNLRDSIKNQAGAVLQAANDVDLHSQMGAFTNTGLIASKSANINLSTATTIADITINNIGGSLQAEQGAINIRDQLFKGPPNTTLSGGDFISKELNLNSGCGAVNASIENATGAVNVAAGSIRMQANTPVLHVNNLGVAGDPILVNTGGDIDLDAMTPTHGNEFIAIASGDIVSASGGTWIDTSSTTGAGDNVILVAGAQAAEGAQSTIIKGRSATGGDIDLGNLTSSSIDTRSSANGYPGGAVTIVAYAQTPGSSKGGHITLPSGLTVETGGDGAADSGQIVIIGEAKSSRAWPVTIQTGALNTTGSQNASMILVETATPSTDTWPITIDGGGSSPEQSTNGAAISGIFQFGTLREGAISTGTLSAANAGGAVLLLGGSNAAGGPAISTQEISNSGPSGSGRVLLMAGATTTQTHANGFDITTGAIDTHSATAQPGYPVTVVTPGAVSTGSINTSNTSSASVAPTYGGGGEVTLVAGSYYKSKSGITVQAGINSSCSASYPSQAQGVGSATVTLIGLNAGSDITVVNPSGPAIDTSATGENSGAGAVVIATPGAITLEDNDSGSTNVINTSGSQNNTSGSQVFLASGKTTGPAITILASGAAGNIQTTGTSLGDGEVWVLTAGGAYTPGYTVNGSTNPNNFTDLSACQSIGPGTALTIKFQPGSSPKGYCPGGYTAISDSPIQPTQINIVENANSEPLEVPLLVRGSAGINLTNTKSFIKATYVNGTSKNPSCTLKLFGAGPIVAPIGNGTPGQPLGLTNAVSTTGNIGISFLSSPINIFNTTATPGTLSLSSNATITSYGEMVAGKSINVKTTAGSNGGFTLSSGTWWECFNIANAVTISTDGSGSIEGDGQVYCDNIALRSRSGNISGFSGPDFSINAAMVQFNTSGEVNINDGWPAVLKPSTGNPAQFTDSGYVTPSAEAGDDGGAGRLALPFFSPAPFDFP
jgi:hypothetical protein